MAKIDRARTEYLEVVAVCKRMTGKPKKEGVSKKPSGGKEAKNAGYEE